MPVSRESASGNKKLIEDACGSTLFSGVNWLGDSVMTMPAIQEFKRRHPACLTAMLSKPSLTALWKMNPNIDMVIELHPGTTGVIRAAMAVKQAGFERAYVLTQSFRSALVPFLARIPSRTGMPGHHRDWMLTAVIRPVETETRRHQMFEYFDLLGIDNTATPDTH
ncbi:MAG: glycosyltransferase family 9 protein, partial [bacterium]